MKKNNLLGHCSQGFTYQLHFLIGYTQLPSQLLKASQLILKREFKDSCNHHHYHKECIIREFHSQQKTFSEKFICVAGNSICLCRFYLDCF